MMTYHMILDRGGPRRWPRRCTRLGGAGIHLTDGRAKQTMKDNCPRWSLYDEGRYKRMQSILDWTIHVAGYLPELRPSSAHFASSLAKCHVS